MEPLTVREKQNALMAEARALYANEKKSYPLDHWMAELTAFAIEREQELERKMADVGAKKMYAELELECLRELVNAPADILECLDELTQTVNKMRRALKRTRSAKQCNTCLSVKPLEEFAKSTRRVDGRTNKCKNCTHAYNHARNAKLKAERG